jgi:hypothetical protein
MRLTKSNFTLNDYPRYDYEKRKAYLLSNKSCDVLLESFYSTLLKALDKKEHFPIIRIADGEFQFLLGKNEFNMRKPKFMLIKNLLGELYRKVFGFKFEAKSRTYTSGVYAKADFKDVKDKYADCLRYIADKGIVALYTIVKPNFYTEQYLPKLFRFFSKNQISLNENNYIPFYFIYIVLTNKRYANIYNGKNIHLITSFDNERKNKIENTLFALGVKSITWTQISRDRSLFDNIDINKISINTDIVFVGAGVGKVNIFNQLKSFPSLIIDAGYIFETWQDPYLRLERDYCNPHE